MPSLSALGAKAAHFGARYGDGEIAVPRDLFLQFLVKLAFEFPHVAAANAGDVDVVARAMAFVEVPMSTKVQQIELVDQAEVLEKLKGAIDGDTRNFGVDRLRTLEDFSGVQMTRCAFHHLQQHAALPRQANAARAELALEAPGRLVNVDAFAR
ncbi:MAG TPA: hypothetical protein VNE63_18925 [Candidatus Acidoferrales bacterium]|nr:hypothetical protein [Candidatus Acidoferrales bacterium]